MSQLGNTLPHKERWQANVAPRVIVVLLQANIKDWFIHWHMWGGIISPINMFILYTTNQTCHSFFSDAAIKWPCNIQLGCFHIGIKIIHSLWSYLWWGKQTHPSQPHVDEGKTCVRGLWQTGAVHYITIHLTLTICLNSYHLCLTQWLLLCL